jgi:hypothetical protein
MSDGTASEPAVAEFVEYCRTQAGLLSGRVETMTREANALLDEIDAELAEVRSALEERSGESAGTVGPLSAPGLDEPDIDEIEAIGEDLEEKQLLVDARQARIRSFQELSAGYADLAVELRDSVEDEQTALTRVLEFEAETDAPAYFDERQTMLEAALDADENSDGSAERRGDTRR